jgi:hypothetical protein
MFRPNSRGIVGIARRGYYAMMVLWAMLIEFKRVKMLFKRGVKWFDKLREEIFKRALG